MSSNKTAQLLLSLPVSPWSLQLCTQREGLLAGEGLPGELRRPVLHQRGQPRVRRWLLQARHL